MQRVEIATKEPVEDAYRRAQLQIYQWSRSEPCTFIFVSGRVRLHMSDMNISQFSKYEGQGAFRKQV